MFWFLACGPRPMPTCEIGPVDAGALRVEDRRILDDLDREVLLRGANAGGRSKFAPYSPFDYDDFDSALEVYMDRPAAWGFSVLRVPFSWAAAEPEQGLWDE